jgi:hypothetical protein
MQRYGFFSILQKIIGKIFCQLFYFIIKQFITNTQICDFVLEFCSLNTKDSEGLTKKSCHGGLDPPSPEYR